MLWQIHESEVDMVEINGTATISSADLRKVVTNPVALTILENGLSLGPGSKHKPSGGRAVAGGGSDMALPVDVVRLWLKHELLTLREEPTGETGLLASPAEFLRAHNLEDPRVTN
jgi:hypothetical protein